MCSPINVVPIFTFKMRRKNLSPPPVYLFNSHYYCTHTSGTRCVQIFPHQANSLCHQLAVLRFNSILIGSIWRYVRSHRWAQSHKTAPCHTHTHTRTHSQSGSQNSRRHLLTFTSLLKDMIKDTDEPPDEKIHRARSERVLRTGASVHMRLVYVTLWLTINSSTSPSPFSKERKQGWKLQATNHGLVFLVASLHSGGSQEPLPP